MLAEGMHCISCNLTSLLVIELCLLQIGVQSVRQTKDGRVVQQQLLQMNAA